MIKKLSQELLNSLDIDDANAKLILGWLLEAFERDPKMIVEWEYSISSITEHPRTQKFTFISCVER